MTTPFEIELTCVILVAGRYSSYQYWFTSMKIGRRAYKLYSISFSSDVLLTNLRV